MKTYNDETIKEEDLPEILQWNNILDRPISLSDLNIEDGEKLDSALGATDVGDMAYEDAVEKAKLGTTILEGGYLKTGFVDASRIDTGTLNAARVSIGSTSAFAAGYDPSSKLAPSDVGDMAFYNEVKAAMEDETIIIGGYIDTSFLTADNIQAGTLTGRTVRTASSGKRVEILSGSSNKITLYDEENKSTTIESFYIGAKHHFGLYYDTGHYLEFGGDFETILATPNGDVKFQSAGFYFGNDLLPDTNETLGNSSYRWAGVYANYIRSYGDIRVDDDLTVYGGLGVSGTVLFSGAVVFSNLPTSAGVSGQLYKDGDYVKIS